jgi:DNA processing protein
VTANGEMVPDEVERAAWIAFSRVAGIGAQRTRRLLERFGSLATAWEAPTSAFYGIGLDQRVIDSLAEVRRTHDSRRELDRIQALRATALTWFDAEYPPALKAVVDSPPVLYVRGRFDALTAPAVAIVGTRRATGYGREQSERFAGELVNAGWVVVSGLARGVDTLAHRGALAARTPSGSSGVATIAVLGHGIDTVYPPENRGLAAQIAERGAIVADYPIGVGPAADHFPARNRIISGLSLGTLVIEAPHGSGALITATYANEHGRQVFAVPGQVTSPASEGCHKLIQDGARLATRAEDIVMDLLPSLALLGRGTEPASTARLRSTSLQLALDIADRRTMAATQRRGEAVVALSDGGDAPSGDDENDVTGRIMATLHAAGRPVHVDDIVRACGSSAPDVTAALMLLELEGAVRDEGGMTYAPGRVGRG